MVTNGLAARILLVRPWTEPIGHFRAALREAGIDAKIWRVDIEPALNAALERATYDVIVFDPSTPHITRATIEELVRDHHRLAPIVVFDSMESVVGAIKHVLTARLN